MSDGGQKNTGKKTPRWESELWSLLSSGDGQQCPLYSDCTARLHSNKCLEDDRRYVSAILNAPKINLADFEVDKRTANCKVVKLVHRLSWQWLQRAGIQYPPVPNKLIYQVDKEFPIEVHRIPLKTCHGALWRTKDSWVIYINSQDTPVVQRYTIFHEAFHILAHLNATPTFCSRKTGEAGFNEELACLFASFVLQPRKWLRAKWTEFQDLDKMVEIFQSPKPALYISLKARGLLK